MTRLAERSAIGVSRAARRYVYRDSDHLGNPVEVDVLSQQGGTAPPCHRGDETVDETSGCDAGAPAPSVYARGRLKVRRRVDRR